MTQHGLTPREEGEPTVRTRQELSNRLDDLRGFGILPTSYEGLDLEGEEGLVCLALSLVDSLESTQRRVIETSIHILSLRELVAKLLRLRTPAEVTETVTLYLQKAFDHERVLVGVYKPPQKTLEGWAGVRNGAARCEPFELKGDWEGGLLTTLETCEPFRNTNGDIQRPFLKGRNIPSELKDFVPVALGPYIAYPLKGRGSENNKVVGVLMVGRGTGGEELGDMEAEVLGSVVEAVGTALENVILEEDARREEAFRKDIMGSMASGLIAVDLDGRVLAMNAGAEGLIKKTLEDLHQGSLTDLDPPGGGIAELLTKTVKTRRPILRVERVVRRSNGSAFPASCATTLLRNPQGEVYGAVVTFDDLSQIKGMEEQIRALDRLAALGRFTAGIAHEIRNPLTGIGTGVQYLQRHLAGDDAHAENLGFIQSEIVRLNGIVEDLFRVTHPRPLQKTLEDPEKMLQRAVQSLGDLPAEKNVTIKTHIEPELAPVPVDPDQIQQVLINLVKNAVEAVTEGGRVELHAYTSSEEDRPHAVFQIHDSGPGIAPETMAQMFEPFFTKGKPGGTGLGLYVSHGIVERHGGELHAANDGENGAVFTLRLPLDTYDLTEILS